MLSVFKVAGTANGANLMTKHLSPQQLAIDMENCGMVRLEGRHPLALNVEIDLVGMSKASVLMALIATTQVAAANDFQTAYLCRKRGASSG